MIFENDAFVVERFVDHVHVRTAMQQLDDHGAAASRFAEQGDGVGQDSGP